MNIRGTAWHFRVYRFLISMWSEGPDVIKGRRTLHEPRDLCHYFWALVLLALTLPIWMACAVLVIIFYVIFLVGLAIWDFVVVPPFQKLGDKINEAEAKRPPKERKEKQPGLLRTYMKARKQKLCPVITIVDE